MKSNIEIYSKYSVPTFKEYRRENDAVMVPDKGFAKQLKALDPELRAVWDWGSTKWEIWRFPEDGKDSSHVMTVETKGKNYRELGTDILLKVREADPWRFPSTKALIAYFEELDNQVQRRQAKDFKNKIESIAKETFNYAQGIMQVQVPRKLKVERSIENA